MAGADSLPELAFTAPEAPAWRPDAAVVLEWNGASFLLADGNERVIAGNIGVGERQVTFDVADARILGFGAATGGPDRNAARFRVLTRDTLFYGIPGASYTAFPFFIARDARSNVGVLLATTEPLDVIVGEGTVSVAGAWGAGGSPLDVIVLRGSAADIVRDLAALVGRTFLPPAWALGFHQSRWSYKTSGAVMDVARRFRELDLPADVIHLDIHYMDRYRVFTFSPRRFQRPRELHEELHALGFRTLAIIDPGVSVAPYPVYETLRREDMLLRRSDGQPYVGRVWPGATAFPDFTLPRVRAAWGQMHRPLVEAGVAGFWNDMNDPVFRAGEVYDPLAEDVQHHGVPHRRVRNLYANGMADATFSGLLSLRPGKRPFVLSRSGFLGIQRHAAVWTGDNHSSWRHLRENLHMVINLGLSGVPITGADVGGFGRGPGKYGAVKPWRPPAELFIRWMELGAFMPFFRAHCTLYAPRQEPWSFGARALALARTVLRRRYQWLPLLYRLALEAHETGLPIVRPLFMHYAVPIGVADDQFLLGDRVLVAPVLDRGATHRGAWLPAGSWTNWWTGEVSTGGQWITVGAPLGRTPVFVRAGSALFMAQPGRNADETLRNPIALEIHPPAPGADGHGSLFLDDGESDSGHRFVLDAQVTEAEGCLRVRLVRREESFVPRQSDLVLRLPAGCRAVSIDGESRCTQALDLAAEGRSARMVCTRVALGAAEIVCEQKKSPH